VLQRVVTDFGAERTFRQAEAQLQEHYGISLLPTTIRRITEGHAQRLHEHLERTQQYPETLGVDYIIAEMDGSWHMNAAHSARILPRCSKNLLTMWGTLYLIVPVR